MVLDWIFLLTHNDKEFSKPFLCLLKNWSPVVSAGGVAKTVVAPLDCLKILFQTRSEFHIIGLLASFRRIAKTEGLLWFYRGNGASVARIIPYAALHDMAYEQYRRQINYNFPGMGNGPIVDLVAGSFSGGTAVLFTYPLDLVRTKLAYQLMSCFMVS